MRKNRRIFYKVISLFLGGAFIFATGCSISFLDNIESEESSSLETSSESASEEQENTILDINAYLSDYFGEVSVLAKSVILNLSTEDLNTALGNENIPEIVIEGAGNNATLTIQGNGPNLIKGANNASLIIKNFEIKNKSTASNTGGIGVNGIDGYLSFGGKVRFENCIFKGTYMFIGDKANAEFVNCKFESMTTNKYALWMSDGSLLLENCEFTGCRGLKIHENNTDIVNVTVDSCKFYNLNTKPGLAIGTISVEVQNTFVVVKNSEFDNCKKWDRAGSIEGIDGFYEADTYTDTFGFSFEEVYVDGVYVEEIEKEIK